jgi:predicted nucleotidyltransferase
MAKKRTKPSPADPPEGYWGADVPMRAIRRFARQVAERFQPDKIILFGSYAYGTPHADSDVDILVIMSAWNKHSKAVQIRLAVEAPFCMDLLVRTPEEMRWRLAEGDLFHTEIVSKGKVLYEKGDARVGAQGRGRLARRAKPRRKKASSA